jgi:hypothetical protein
MARSNPYRRTIVTTMNTILATAAVAGTVAGWAAFGLADTSSATAAAQPDPIVQQAAPSSDQPFTSPRHRRERQGQGALPFGGGSSSGSSGQSVSPSAGSSSQGGVQPRRPITRTRSSR